MKTNQNDQTETQSKKDVLGAQKFTFAIIIFIVYLIFVAYLVFKTNTDDDLIWTRLLYLFTGIEAIVFAAIGYVFGKDINRSRAENAEQDAKKSKQEEEKAKKEAEKAKEEAQKEKEKGIELSTAVKTSYANDPNIGLAFTKSRSSKSNSNSSFLINLANNLYPSAQDYVTVSFDYSITPEDNINDITINSKTKEATSGSYSGVPIYNNRFSIDVDRKDSLKDWTLKITRIKDSNGNDRKQVDGKTESKYDSAYVQLESL